MHIILVLLLASLICCTNGANEKKDGGEIEQNPNDPKYQKMAQEIVYYHKRLKKRDVKKIIVLRVTTHVFAGILTKIKFRVLFHNRQPETCNSEILELFLNKLKHVTFTCSGPRVPQTTENPNGGGGSIDYENFAKQSVKNYFKKNLTNYSILNTKVKGTSYATTSLLKHKIMYIAIDVTIRAGRIEKHTCSVVFNLPNTIPVSTKCIENRNKPGANYWVDPSKKKYLDFAEQSLLQLKVVKHDTLVTFVKQQVVNGRMNTIYFQVNTISKRVFKCQARVWENITGQNVIKGVKCPGIPPSQNSAEESKPHNDNDEKPAQPEEDTSPVDLAKYHGLGKASVKDYFTTQPDKQDILEINIRNVAQVTTRVRRQKILYMNYDVVLRGYKNAICSVLFVLPSFDSLDTHCIENKHELGGNKWVDPSSSKYLDLAEKSLLNSKSASLKLNQSGHDTIVTFVVQQVVAGHKYNINFIIRPVNGHEYECLSRAWEQMSGINVIEEGNCRLRTTGLPNEPEDETKYHGLGKAAVEDYFKNQPNKPDIKETNIINIAYVSTRVYHKKIIYINYIATVSPTINHTCSVLFAIPGDLPLSTKCSENNYLNMGGYSWEDPSKEKYLSLAEKAGVFGRNNHDTIVTYVEKAIVSGFKYKIEFIARPVDGQDYECTINVWQTLEKVDIYQNVACRLRKPSSDVLTVSGTSDFEVYNRKDLGN